MMALFKNWWMVGLKGLLLVLFGLYAVTRPGEAIMALVTFAGLVSLLGGLLLIVAAFTNTDKKNWGWTLAEGIFDVVFGGIILTYPFGSAVAAATLFSVFLGFWALFGGFTLIGNAIRLRKTAGSRWGFILAVGILTLIVGWAIITNPLANTVALTVIIGIFAIVFGIGTIIWAFELKSRMQEIETVIAENESTGTI